MAFKALAEKLYIFILIILIYSLKESFSETIVFFVFYYPINIPHVRLNNI